MKKMRDLVKTIDIEKDKINTFKTPLPNPKIIGNYRKLENTGKQKILNGIVMQNLFGGS